MFDALGGESIPARQQVGMVLKRRSWEWENLANLMRNPLYAEPLVGWVYFPKGTGDPETNSKRPWK